jgi:ATP-dependent DNA helicase Rep/DNA helicase-2/ATP-dependent DNA helicase PcrA
MNKPTYATAAEELRDNSGQWSAYESKGNCVVLAGPGAGKTKTITIKIARLLDEVVRKPQRLACITYSNACVGELAVRLRKLGVGEDDRLLLSTVHSFCLTELVLPFAALAGVKVPDPLVVASPSQSAELFRKAYAKVHGGQAPKWYRTEFDKLRRTVLDRDSKQWKDWPLKETQVVETYEEMLLTDGVIDFDGLVLAGLELVETHKWVRSCIRAKYPVMVIDEYQDLGAPLHRMVLALMNKAAIRIIAVGDPDQSIYGFTGAQPGLLRKLSTLPEVEAVGLKLNYRCADQIITASRALLQDPQEYESPDGRQGEIRIHRLECDVRGQADYAMGTIVPALLKNNPGWKRGDIAFLYRSLNEGKAIAEAADGLGIRYFRLDNGSPVKRSRLTEWLTDAAKWCAGGWKSGTVVLSQLLKSWRSLRRSLDMEKKALQDRARLISILFAFRDGSVPLRKWLMALNDALLQRACEEEPGLAEEKDNFRALLDATEPEGALESYSIEIFGNQGKSPDQINLITLHSSKGLEFEAVIMIGLERGVFPNKYDNTNEKIQESARLFYVGVTRAKSIVCLTYESNESPFVTTIRKATA